MHSGRFVFIPILDFSLYNFSKSIFMFKIIKLPKEGLFEITQN